MADLTELYTKYVESRNKYPQIRQAAEIALMGEIVERIKALDTAKANNTQLGIGSLGDAHAAAFVKRGPGRPPKEAPDAA
jgi:hypothetical protein